MLVLTYVDFLKKCLFTFRLEKDTASIQRQLSEELKEKKNVISKMSKQLDLHQRNFDELKDELNRVRFLTSNAFSHFLALSWHYVILS